MSRQYFFVVIVALASVVNLSGLINTFVQTVTSLLSITDILLPAWPTNAVVKDGNTYDIIIVGSGSAGSVLANRLTERSDLNVLVIEAGGNPPLFSVVIGAGFLLPHTSHDWDQLSYNDNYSSQAHKQHCIAYTRGKMLGGSSSINYMFYVRGNHYDYDFWAKLGNKGWNSSVALTYFKKCEKMMNKITSNPTYAPYHNTTGPVIVTGPRRSASDEALNDNILKSFKESLDLDTNIDYNGPKQEGISRPYFTFSDKMRSSTAQAYLVPARNRDNLHIIKNSLVTEILREGNKVTGVKYQSSSGETIKVYANNEVILSAGAINTPQLLMLSGIGPKDELDKFNIPLIADLPVGRNMEDHLMVPLFIKHRSGLLGVLKNVNSVTSILTGLPVPTLIGFYSSDEGEKRPKLEVIPVSFPQASPLLAYLISVDFTYNDEVTGSVIQDNILNNVQLIILSLLHPKSKGKVVLKSVDPEDDPEIHTGFFSDDDDLEYMATAIENLSSLENAKFYDDNNGKIVKLKLPACDQYTYRSHDYWRCYCKQMSGTIWHQTGTTRMGDVVDSSGNVKQMKNLRVVDAGIMPSGTSGNINAPTMMMAEKIADDIKADYPA